MMVVGNKADMKKRAVSKQEGKTLADEFGADFIEVSVRMIDCIYIVIYNHSKVSDIGNIWGFLFV